jgi:hypothetical protein
VCRIARDASNVEKGVQFLYWALNLLKVFPSLECAGFARNPAKVEDQVQFLARAFFVTLKPNGEAAACKAVRSGFDSRRRFLQVH